MEEAENRALEEALEQVPRGAFALAGASVALLMLAWLAIYFLIFLPRGQVG
jgi:asparagine N-glycosylation enzyme membrane subunit Stt3